MGNSVDKHGDVFFFIPHTHWEGAVFKTREQYLEMGLPIILRALRLLKLHPDYRFTLDQACYVGPFLRRYPEQRVAFLSFVREGRLAIVGGTDTMADVNMPGGESFVRQILYGKGCFRRELGVDVTTSWQLDTFGHHAQMPQLLKLAGYTSFWFFRGVADTDVPAEFLWEGIDGSQIAAFWLPFGYALTYGSPSGAGEFAQFIEQRFAALTPFARAPGRVGLAGADVCEPEEHVPERVAEFNRRTDRPFRLQLAVPADFEAMAAERGHERDVVTGELNPIFQGTYSSRIELKQAVRELETDLTTAEKLGVLLAGLGQKTDATILWRAWEPMLFNQAHDLMSGVMTDHVYDDTLSSFGSARRLAVGEVRDRLSSLISSVDTQGEGIPLVVFNAMSWPRTDVASADIGLIDDGINDLNLVGTDGKAVAFQIMESERNAGGSLSRVKITFIARDIPALGYASYRVLPLRSATPTDRGAETVDEAVLENDYYRLELDLHSGAITGLLVKEGDWDALRGAANVVAMEEDRGDLWEPYRPLDGASNIAMKECHPAPGADGAVFSNAKADERGTVKRGPVMSEFEIMRPFGTTGRFSTTIRLYAGLPRIDIHTEILNNEEFVRYRVLFPTTIARGESIHEIPFGAISRPEGIEFPAQNWMDYSDTDKGVALLNRGLPGNNVADGTMMLSLARCTSIVAYGFGGGYEPGMSSQSGFELGKTLSFDYALLPHIGDWRDAGLYREGMAFNSPLLAHTAACQPGVLPTCWGFLRILPANVVVSALKPGENGGTVLRIYEAEGRAASGVKISLAGQVSEVYEVDLMEDPLKQLAFVDGVVALDLAPHEIKTLRFELGDLTAG